MDDRYCVRPYVCSGVINFTGSSKNGPLGHGWGERDTAAREALVRWTPKFGQVAKRESRS